ncbi:hypothetical protein AJ78_08663, partial [Emergomyces pasteurianus Ep9510]
MFIFYKVNDYRLFNDKLNYIKDVFSEHSNNNIKKIKKTNSKNSKNSKNSYNSNEKILENDKLSSLKHYKTEKTTLN